MSVPPGAWTRMVLDAAINPQSRSLRMAVPGKSSTCGWPDPVLRDVEQFDVEHQRGIRRDDTAGAASAVGKFRRQDQAALPANLHTLDTLVPPADHLAGAEAEGEG